MSQEINTQTPPPARRPAFSIAAVLLVLLILSSGIWFGAAHFFKGNAAGQRSQSSTSATVNPTGLGSVTVHGITLSVKQAYADATRTALAVSISPSGLEPEPLPPGLVPTGMLPNFSLRDSTGHVLANRELGFTANATSDSGIWVFEALSRSELGSTQQLTLTVTKMSDGIPGDTSSVVTGPWIVHFTIPTVAIAYSATFSNLAVTKKGVTLRVLAIATSFSSTQFDGYPGGLNLILSITSPYCVAGLASNGYGVTTGPTTLTFAVDGNSPAPPTSISSETSVPTGYCKARPGNMDIYTMQYLTPLTAQSKTLTVTIPYLVVGASGNQRISGPWTVVVPLR